MRHLRPTDAAHAAAAVHEARPATAMILDVPDVRMVVFRMAPHQEVPPHRSPSTVVLEVLEGSGLLFGREGWMSCSVGDVVVYEPGEVHAMRACDDALVLMATLTPRPGERAP